jgi:hypothetical protein
MLDANHGKQGPGKMRCFPTPALCHSNAVTVLRRRGNNRRTGGPRERVCMEGANGLVYERLHEAGR